MLMSSQCIYRACLVWWKCHLFRLFDYWLVLVFDSQLHNMPSQCIHQFMRSAQTHQYRHSFIWLCLKMKALSIHATCVYLPIKWTFEVYVYAAVIQMTIHNILFQYTWLAELMTVSTLAIHFTKRNTHSCTLTHNRIYDIYIYVNDGNRNVFTRIMMVIYQYALFRPNKEKQNYVVKAFQYGQWREPYSLWTRMPGIA